MIRKVTLVVFASFLFLVLDAIAVSQTARLQVIHNAADPAADSVDVYVNGARLLSSFHFRTATPFITVPAGVPLNVGIAPAKTGGSVVGDTLKNFTVSLKAGETYVAIANGVVSPAGFAPNPGGKSIAFNLFAASKIRERGISRFLVDVNVFHGATDAPAVDVVVRGFGFLPLVSNLSYGGFSGYRSVPGGTYTLDVTPAGNRTSIVASFRAELGALRGGAAVVFASGFLNSSQNQNGASFGLFAALSDGKVVELPRLGGARLQVIHNAADPGADSVDVYVNGARLLKNFKFRTATPFVDVPAGVPVNIGVAPPNSGSVMDTLKNFVVTFAAGRTYTAVANGVLNPLKFSANPNGRDIAFTVFASDRARERGITGFLFDFNVFHGATDAPSVDVKVRGLGFLPLVRGLAYGEFTGYLSVPALRYVLNVTPAGRNAVVASYVADLRGLAGKSATVFASGFLDPARNQNGPAFGLFVALADGKVVALPQAGRRESDMEMELDKQAAAGTEKGIPQEFALLQNYPNPFNPTTVISYQLPVASEVKLVVYDVLGREVATLVNETQQGGNYSVTFDASALPSGTYVYRLEAGTFTATRKFVLVK